MIKSSPVTFGIRHLLLMLTGAALSTVSLVFATPLWGSLWFSVSMAVLLTAIALSILSSGQRKAFWVGVAIFGWGYWLILHASFLSMTGPGTLMPLTNSGSMAWRLEGNGPPLLSSLTLEWIYSKVLPVVHEEPTSDANGVRTNDSRYPDGPTFMRVGHSLIALAVAVIGGFLVLALSRPNATQSQHT